jgi:hypothetical protein
MSVLKKAFAAAAIFATFTTCAMASVIQSAGPVNYDSSGWHNDKLIGFQLAKNTTFIDALSGSSTTYDQGWGGNDPGSNQLYITLMDNGNSLWGDHFAGGARGATFQSYSVSSDALTNLNNALAAINWSGSHVVELQVRSSTLGYGGWELHARNVQFQATSEVPEPASLAIVGLGLLGLAAARRKTMKK